MKQADEGGAVHLHGHQYLPDGPQLGFDDYVREAIAIRQKHLLKQQDVCRISRVGGGMLG